METTNRSPRSLSAATFERMNKLNFFGELFRRKLFKVADLLNHFDIARVTVNYWFEHDNMRLSYLLAVCDIYDLTLCVNFSKKSSFGSFESSIYYVGDPKGMQEYIENAKQEAEQTPEGKSLNLKTYEAANFERKKEFCKALFSMREDLKTDLELMKVLGISRPGLNSFLKTCGFSTDHIYKLFDVEGGSVQIFFEGYMPE